MSRLLLHEDGGRSVKHVAVTIFYFFICFHRANSWF